MLKIIFFTRMLIVSMLGLFLCHFANAEELIISGSGNPEFVLGELAKVFNTQQSIHRVVIPRSTGHAGAVRDVSENVTSLGRVGRPLSESEAAKGLIYVPLGRDAIAIATGSGVAVRAISSEQLKAVFAGKITDWSELGGARAPIRVIGKESTDAVRRQISAQYRDMVFADSVKIVHLDTYLIELLDRYPSSFTIINRSALGACKSKVGVMAFEGVEPTIENIANGSYPLVVEYGFVHKAGGPSPAGKAFIEFVQSPEGRKILRKHGVLAKHTSG